MAGGMMEVVLIDRLGKKMRVQCNEDDTIEDVKKLVAVLIGTRPEKIRIRKWYTLINSLIQDDMGLELYYKIVT